MCTQLLHAVSLANLLTCCFLWSWRRGKRSWLSRCMRNLQFYVTGKRPMLRYPSVCTKCMIYSTSVAVVPHKTSHWKWPSYNESRLYLLCELRTREITEDWHMSLLSTINIPVKVALDISGSPIESRWASRKYLDRYAWQVCLTTRFFRGCLRHSTVLRLVFVRVAGSSHTCCIRNIPLII